MPIHGVFRMPSYTSSDIRNVALMGPAGSGKTTLVEAMLKEAGVIGTMGTVERGDTASDFTPEEKEHNHSFFTSLLNLDHKGKHINIIDTPGATDFVGQALSAMPAVETAAVVINAAVGVEPAARKLMERAGERKLCRMLIVNRIDQDNVDLATLLDSIQETFGKECLPVNLPAEGGTKIIDCFAQTQGESDLGSVADFHTAIIDQVVEVDEKLMETYLEQGEVKPEQLHEPFETALRQGHLIPVLFLSAHPHNAPDSPVGVDMLLDMLVNLGPSPAEGNPKPFTKGDSDDVITFEPDESASSLAHAFSIRVDPFVGKLAAMRVHRGKLSSQSALFMTDVRGETTKKPVRIAHLFKVQGKDHKEVDSAIPGDIVAVAKVEEVHFSTLLHESEDDAGLKMVPVKYPEPMSGLAITPKKRGDEQKIGDALSKLQEEDPTFKVTRDSTTHETVIHGLGELHLRVILEKLKNRDNVEVDTKPPKIAYRETVQAKAEGHHRHKKQTGGAGQFGEVFLRIEPLERDAGFEFVDDTFGGSIPQQFMPAVEKGIRHVLEGGAIAGYPMQDVKVSVYDGKHHPVDSKEVAFVTAGKRAFIDAVQKAKPALLEPMVHLEVTVPNQFMGDITGDLSGKRGRIQGTNMMPGDQCVIEAIVPLAEISNYQGQLKSVTGGQGSFAMELSHYDPVPSNVQQEIIAQYKPQAEED